jgi:hypothetical protein
MRGSIQRARLTRSRPADLLAAALLLSVVSVAGCTGSSGATGRGGTAPAGAVSGCGRYERSDRRGWASHKVLRGCLCQPQLLADRFRI